MAVPENMEVNTAVPGGGKVYLLRPHHGMCLAFFIGKGYSDGFTENLSNMLEILMDGAFIRLCAGADEICLKCPNRCLNVCESEEKVIRYDRAVLSACGLKEGDVLAFEEFTRAVQTHIIETGRRTVICSDCSWSRVCAGVKSRWGK